MYMVFNYVGNLFFRKLILSKMYFSKTHFTMACNWKKMFVLHYLELKVLIFEFCVYRYLKLKSFGHFMINVIYSY